MKAKIVCALMICHAVRYVSAAENDLQFNSAFLNGESGNIADLSWVNAGSALPPGEYNINVYINKNYAFTGNVKFSVDKNAAQEDAQPCVTASKLPPWALIAAWPRKSCCRADPAMLFFASRVPRRQL